MCWCRPTPFLQRQWWSVMLMLVLLSSSASLVVDAYCACAYRLPVLQELYDATNGAAWVRPWNMTAVDAPCGFEGVTCGSDVSSIVLSGRGLDGTLPPSLGQLRGLVTFVVNTNSLRGSLPIEFSNWTSLNTIVLRDNEISGTLPPEYSAWVSLGRFDAYKNKLSGTLPPVYSALTGLYHFDVWSNMISGTLPPEYSSWVNLQWFYAHFNQLSGSLPAEYSSWTQLRNFSISTNNFTGSLPAAYSSWVELGVFDASNNKFNGTLPPEYSKWMNLQYFYASSNQLSGSLPAEYSSWTQLRNFSMSTNNFTGSLPGAYSSWVELGVFDASNNKFNGTLPPEYSNWTNLQYFYADSNQLSGSLPAEYSSWTQLWQFTIRTNNFTGSLPSAYSSCVGLQAIKVSNNMISGTLPPEYSNWGNLQYFYAESNQLSGSLPAEYSSWKQLITFLTTTNVLAGSLPGAYKEWIRVSTIRLSNNSITGILPPEYAALGALNVFDVSYNNITGTIPVQYAVWKNINTLRLESNALSGTIPNALFVGWSNASLIALRMNMLTGTVPTTLLALPALQVLLLASNVFTGNVHTTISTSIVLLDLQNNTGLVGTLPFQYMLVTVCGTGVCPTALLPLQYCLPPEAVELVATTASDVTSIISAIAPYSSRCTPTDATPTTAHLTTQPDNITAAGGNMSTSLNAATRSISATVAFVSSIVGSGGAARGAVPSLQRATTALRLAALCSSSGNTSSSDVMFSDPSDNAFVLSVPVGSSGLEYAAGATIGNALFVVAVGGCLHAVALLRGYLCGACAATTNAVWGAYLRMLPSSLLPGALAVAYGTQLQPSVGATVALIVSDARTAQSVVCGVALLAVWLAFALYCVHRVLVACRGKDGKFGLTSIHIVEPRKRRHRGHGDRHTLVAQVLLLRTFLIAPRSEWEVPHSSSHHRAEAAFVLKHLEPVFGAYVGRREWYFVVEWSLVAVGGVVTGVAEAVAADGDACGAAVWATWCMIVLGAVQIAATVALRPFSVLFEMITSVAIGVLSLLSVVLSLVGVVDAADVIVNVAGVLELVVMIIMLVNVAAFRCRGGGERAVVATDSYDKFPDFTPVVIQPARLKRKAKISQTIERRDQGVDADTTHSEQLRALIELACARAQV